MKGKNWLKEFVAEIIDINGLLFSIQFILKFFLFGMSHDYNIRHKHESVSGNDSASNHDPLVKLEENIINCINNLKGEIVNLKGIVIKRLHNENEKLKTKCSTLGNKVATLEQNLNSLGLYSRINTLVLSGIPENILDNQLGTTIASISSETGVNIQPEGIKACHRNLENWQEEQIQKN